MLPVVWCILYFTLFFIGNKTLHTIIIYTLDMFFVRLFASLLDRMREVAGRSLLFFFKGGLITCLPGKQ